MTDNDLETLNKEWKKLETEKNSLETELEIINNQLYEINTKMKDIWSKASFIDKYVLYAGQLLHAKAVELALLRLSYLSRAH
jgi:predicted  nucleic acid-binding Zn-ribbon protein